MPSCLVNYCTSSTKGSKLQMEHVILHLFPSDVQRIKLWLSNTGQIFNNIEELAMRIKEGNKTKKYRMCSLHFRSDCYIVNVDSRHLRPDAVPTIFPSVEEGENVIEESLKKKANKRKRINEVSAPSTSQQSSSEELTSSLPLSSPSKYVTIATQTDATLFNSSVEIFQDRPAQDHLIGMEEHLSSPEFPNDLRRNIHPTTASTPIDHNADIDFRSPQKKRAHLGSSMMEISKEDFLPGIAPLSLILEENLYGEDQFSGEEERNSTFLENEGSEYLPGGTSVDDSFKSGIADLIYSSGHPTAPTMKNLSEEEQVKERKFLVFESCLDDLFYNVQCRKSNCYYLVKSFQKQSDGSFLKVSGECYAGHHFEVFRSQPRRGRYYSGNLLLAASILFSGQNYQKVQEFLNILGMVSISEATYYRYQPLFPFPVIDRTWKEQRRQNLEELSTLATCFSGDGQCDSPGHSAKYCVYTMMDCVIDKIVDFEVVQRSQCTSSVAMEKFGFEICLNRLMKDGVNIKIFASDRHVGVCKIMATNHNEINQQFDIWHYAKSLKKQLSKASAQRLCKEIKLWTDKIINHFWWSIRTCQEDPELLQEKWLSLLHHIIDQHEWEGRRYTACGHGNITTCEDKKIFWLKKETPSYASIEKIVTSKQLIKDLPHLSYNCHTGSLEVFHSLALKYRTKRIHLKIDAMEARTKLAALTHNNNIGRQQAVIHCPRKNTEDIGEKRTKLFVPKSKKRWLVKNVYENIKVDY
ncbi:uncharacterized protein [Dendropsophus ebraccatus]|uniref:uncharacterized protein n=1 Tax=Dendropsophus ebraccatus TaxID=150705 RepID=UPI0038321B91